MQCNRLRILFIIVFIVQVSACSESTVILNNSSAHQPIDIKNLEITLAVDDESVISDSVKELAEKFNQNNVYGIKVNTDISTLPAGSNPDCEITTDYNAAYLYKTGQITDLSHFINNQQWGIPDWRKQFCKAVRRQSVYRRFGKHTISVPIALDSQIVIFNKDILKYLGYEKLPKSWFRTNILLFKASRRMKPVLGLQYDVKTLTALVSARGGSILQPAGFNYSMNNPVVTGTERYLRRLENYGILSCNDQKYKNQTDFAFGKLLMVVTSIDGIEPYFKMINLIDNKMEWDVALIPTRKPGDGIFINCNNSAVIYSGDKRNELASWFFIKWLIEEEQQQNIALQSNTLPARLDIIPNLIESSENTCAKQWNTALKLVSGAYIESLNAALYDYENVSSFIDESITNIRNDSCVWLEALKLTRKINKCRRDDKWLK
ncbi:MAG: ABC transporter substrate-binding protein [Spirochaetales bacterium]|nr:ABC transporter substrate-binding protein [Spirochaetales bacterium]